MQIVKLPKILIFHLCGHLPGVQAETFQKLVEEQTPGGLNEMA